MIKMIKKVSVIIPTYNHAHYIKRAIESVLNQTYKDFEIIVVDDGSIDNTQSIINSFGNLITYIYQDNKGLASARNTGISIAKGEFIAFLDADDYFAKDNLEKKMSLLENNPDAGWIYSDWQYVDENYNYIVRGSVKFKYADKKLTDKIFEDLLYNRNFISPCTVILKKSILKDVGYFDESIQCQEDYDLWLRISLKYPAYYIDEALVFVTVHFYSLSKDFSKWTLGNALIIDKLGKIIPKDFNIKKGFITQLQADKFTFLARSYAQNEEFRKALKAYLQSIKILPLQKRIYWLLMTLLFSSIKYYFNFLVILKKQK